MTDPNLPPAGWYDDSTGTGTLRYWDGAQWTEHTTPAAALTDAASPEASAADANAHDVHAVGSPTLDSPDTDTAASGAPAVDANAHDVHAVGSPTLDSPDTDAAASGAPAVDASATEHAAPGSPGAPGASDAQGTEASGTEAPGAPAHDAVPATSWATPIDGSEAAPATATTTAPPAAQPYGQGQQPYGQGQQTYGQGQQTYGQDQQPYGQGQPMPATEPGGKKPVHVLGIIALAVAGLGFVLACIPATVLFGWVLLPIGLVLSIVALFMKGAKWPGIVGISVSVVGMIVAAIVSIVAFIVAVGEIEQTIDEFDSGSSAIEEEFDSEYAPEVFGSREEPLAIGELISTDEFDVVINSVDLNATEQVLAADEYNEPPADGETYAIVNLTVTYKGEDSASDAMVGIDYVSADGVVKDDAYAYAWGIEPEFGTAELFTGGSATSNLVLLLPSDPDGVLFVSPGFYDEAWVSLR